MYGTAVRRHIHKDIVKHGQERKIQRKHMYPTIWLLAAENANHRKACAVLFKMILMELSCTVWQHTKSAYRQMIPPHLNNTMTKI